jgi:TonB family protein
MSSSIRSFLLGAGLFSAISTVTLAAADDAPPPQTIGLRVTVDDHGKVQSAQPSDPQAVPALNRAAEEIARKLVFTPARKNGVAVTSETTLTLTLTLQLEKRGDGQFGLQLKRAYNGPGVLAVGKMVPPKYQQGREGGALVVVGVMAGADGAPDVGTISTERMELRVPSKFAEARYLDAVSTSLHGTRFELDKVDGVTIPSHLSVPYIFGGGPVKPKPGEDDRHRETRIPESMEMPALRAVSNQPGIELAKIDYHAPAAAPGK